MVWKCYGADLAIGADSLFGVYFSQNHSRYAYIDRAQELNSHVASGGIYARGQPIDRFFTDFMLSGGYIEADGGQRSRANNLVANGIEYFAGSHANGKYVTSTLRTGIHWAVDDIELITSLSGSYAAHWGNGYSETGTAAQTVEAHLVQTATATLEMAAVWQHDNFTTQLQAGIQATHDFSESTELQLLGQPFEIEIASDKTQIGGFIGFGLYAELQNSWTAQLDANATIANIPDDITSDIFDLVGLNAGAGLRIPF